MISTVFLVNWAVTADSVGGFQWAFSRDAAESYRRFLHDPTAEVHIVALPAIVGEPREGEDEVDHNLRITEWLDDEGWSNGGTHHLTSAELVELSH